MLTSIEQIEREFRVARDAAYDAAIEISAREWSALKAKAHRVENGSAYDATGREIGRAFFSEKYGLCAYRLTAEHAALTAALHEVDGRLMAARKAAGLCRPTGADLEAQRIRSRAGQTRPAGAPRAHHITKND